MTALPTSPLLKRPRRTEAEYRAGVSPEECVEARNRLIQVSFTMDELTRLMHALEVAKDEAYQAVMRHEWLDNPVYPQVRPEDIERRRDAARNTLDGVTNLCDMITDIWAENRDRR